MLNLGLMFTYEAAPKNFADSDIGLPESGNGIPDILDEAVWLMRYLHRTRQAMITAGYGTGGVGGGHAAGDGCQTDDIRDNIGRPSWEDNQRDQIISGEEINITVLYAAMAAQMAFILQSLGKTDVEGVNWQQEAVTAWNWAIAKGGSEVEARMYAGASLYRLTGEEKYHNQFKIDFAATKIRATTILYANSDFTTKEEDVMSDSRRPGVYMYTLSRGFRPVDAAISSAMQGALYTSANLMTAAADARACRWAGDFGLPMVIGQGTTPRVQEIIFAIIAAQKDNDATKAANYKKYLYTTADYFLGTNPLKTSWITGFEEKSPKQIFQYDSWFSGAGTAKNGYVPYGPYARGLAWSPATPFSSGYPSQFVYPTDIAVWPGHERWFEQRYSPSAGEFTIHQNNLLAAMAYGFLCEAKNDPAVAVTSVSISPSSVTFTTEGQTQQLTATVSPSNASNKGVYWYSENTDIATVDNTGKVTAVVNGVTNVGARTFDGAKVASVQINSNVPIVNVGSVVVTGPSTTLYKNNTAQLTATVTPSNATNKKVTWTTSNAAAATVSGLGIVSGLTPGTAIITATSQADGSKIGTYTVNVLNAADFIIANLEDVTPSINNVVAGKSQQFAPGGASSFVSNPTVSPANNSSNVIKYDKQAGAYSLIGFQTPTDLNIADGYRELSFQILGGGLNRVYVQIQDASSTNLIDGFFDLTGSGQWQTVKMALPASGLVRFVKIYPNPVDAISATYYLDNIYLTSNGSVPAEIIPPTAPTGLTSSAISSSSFTVTWTAATDDVGVTGYEVFTGTVSRGTTSSLSLNVTGLTVNTAYSVTVKAKDAAGNVSPASTAISVTTNPLPNITASKTAVAMTVDGNLNESAWTITKTVTKVNVGTPNNTVTYGVTWNDTYLFVGIKVLDASLNAVANNIVATDGVEIYLDPNNAKTATYEASDRQFIKGHTVAALWEKSGSITGVLNASTAISGGYAVELGIPWTNLGITPSNNLKIGFDVANNDNDDGSTRGSQLVWTGDNNNWQNTSAWGELILSGAPSATVAVTSVNIVPSAITITVGGASNQLAATILPSNATNQAVTWTVADNTKATVSSTGLVAPVAVGTTNVTVTTSDGSKTDVCAVTVVVAATASVNTPYGGTAHAIPGTIQVEDYDNGGQGIGYNDTDASNLGGQYRTSEGVDVETCSEGGYNIGWTAANEWTKYTVNVSTAGSYKVIARVAVNSAATMAVSFSGNSATTGDMSLSASGGWQSWVSVTSTSINLAAGQQTMTFFEKSGNFNINYIQVVSASATANVALTSVNIVPTSISVSVGNTSQLSATITPSNATNQNVSWTSSNTAVASVNASGLVSAVAAGTANVTVTTSDGSKTHVCAVTVSASTGCSGTGGITAQRWDGISGNAVSNLTSNANYPNTPSSTSALTSFEAATDAADNYGLRVLGYICPPTSGSYTFWIAGDDNVELWLSTNNSASNKVKIASHTDWTSSREWNKYTTQKSAAISLTAGTQYYVEALMKEDGGGDNLAVGWAKPGEATASPSEVIPGSSLIPFSASATVNVTSVNIAPTSISVTVGNTSQLSATIAPTNATNKSVSWTSSNTAVASVNASGLVSAVAAGTANVTVTTSDGSKTDVCAVTVSATAPSLVNFFTQAYTGTRNDFTGNLGFRFIPTAASVTVLALGRPVGSGINNNHIVRIWKESDQSIVATVTITPSLPTLNGYKYEMLPAAVVLQLGVGAFRITSTETSGGDQWFEIGTIGAHPSSINVTGGCYGNSASAYPVSDNGGSNMGYVAPTFYTSTALAREGIEVKSTPIRMYPNPTTGKVYMEGVPEGAELSVTDMNGTTLLNFNNAQEVDLSDFPNGVYFVRVLSPSQNQHFKIFKD